MKKNIFTSILVVLFINTINAQDNYYWTGTGKVFINNTSKKSIQFNDITPLSLIVNSLPQEGSSFDMKNGVIAVENEEIVNISNQFQEQIFKISNVFETNDGLELIVFNEIICKGNPDNLTELTKGVDLDVVTKENNSRFIIKVKDETIDIISLANKIYESGLFEYCYPNFISEVSFNSDPNDPYFNQQFYLKNTGQTINDGHIGTAGADIKAVDAWTVTKGNEDIVIAVIDQGVTSNHPDLPNTRQIRLNGSNFSGVGNVNDPSPTGDDNHGNACAGIIGAEQNNGEGITGVSPESSIMPIKLLATGGSASSNDIADAIEFAYVNGANIISNSWGYNTSSTTLFPAIVDEIQNAIDNNVLVVFAAGNTANHAANNAGFVSFPANNSNIDGLICVGASNRDDEQANYSPTNALVEVVAPSHNAYPSQIAGESFEIWTIDIPGANGYNPCNSGCTAPRTVGELLPSSGTNFQSYTGRMGGTSASCPQVAGVASLLLAVDSTLTPIELENIIKDSADNVGGSAYVDGRSDEMGFGRINSYEALLLTLSYNCIEEITITEDVISGEHDIRQASSLIKASNEINSGATADYSAGETITLKTGFHAVSGSIFKAFIEDCGVSSVPSSSKEITRNVFENKEILSTTEGNIMTFTIYPNPSSGLFNIQSTDSFSTYSITDMSGKQIVFKKINEAEFQINISEFSSGLYFLELQTENGEAIKKKIIKN